MELSVKNTNRTLVAMAGFLLFALSVVPTHAADKMTVKTGTLPVMRPLRGKQASSPLAATV
jgi:hypothetical protein